jgi:hypothetical protein
LAARVSENGFTDVTSGPWSYIPEALIRSGAWESVKFEGALSALGALRSGAPVLGTEASLTAHATLWSADHLPRWLLGADTGFAVRGRWLAGSTPKNSEFQLGLAPILENSDAYRDQTYPSVLGLLLPEVGVGRSSGQTFSYLAWTLPVVFHLESPRERRHPFDARDVLGLRVAPTALVSFRAGSTDWLYGLFAGVTVW